jgi:SAM-dependent methyltransferase
MDAGCGIGNFTQLLSEVADYVLAVERSPRDIKVLHDRFRKSPTVEVRQFDLGEDVAPIKGRQIDSVVCLDVLEHIEDDVALLRSFRQVVRPGGSLLLKVPACPWLFGSIDEASSHYRRYTKKQLTRKAVLAGWKPLFAFYMNVFGVAPYWIKSRVLKRPANFSRTFSPWQIRLLRRTIPALQVADRLIGPPIGLSAMLIAD